MQVSNGSNKREIKIGFELPPFSKEDSSCFVDMMFHYNNAKANEVDKEDEEVGKYKEYKNINEYFCNNKNVIGLEFETVKLEQLEQISSDNCILYSNYLENADHPMEPYEYLQAIYDDEVCPECGEVLSEVGFTANLEVRIEYDKGYGKWRQEYVDDGSFKCNNCEEFIYLDDIADLDFELKIG